ncbi:MAG: hypothetical protein WC011_03980 [Candidatus Paceibacterota bacterium]
MIKGDSEPKSVSWSLWSLLSVINCVTFSFMTDSLLLSLVFIIDSILCIFILFYGVHLKKFPFFNSKDWLFFSIGFVSIIMGFITKNVILANIIICIAYIFSFVPTIKGVWFKRDSENPLSWWMCSIAYLLLIISVFLKNSNTTDFFAPVILFILHLVIALLAKKKQIFENPVNA